jgi:hypothetical protein
VVAVEQDIGGADRHFNANIERFGECLVYYQRYRSSVRTVEKHDIQKIIAATEKNLQLGQHHQSRSSDSVSC